MNRPVPGMFWHRCILLYYHTVCFAYSCFFQRASFSCLVMALLQKCGPDRTGPEWTRVTTGGFLSHRTYLRARYVSPPSDPPPSPSLAPTCVWSSSDVLNRPHPHTYTLEKACRTATSPSPSKRSPVTPKRLPMGHLHRRRHRRRRRSSGRAIHHLGESCRPWPVGVVRGGV